MITQTELLEKLVTIEKGTFIFMETLTDVKMNKTGNPYFGRITKVTHGEYRTRPDYETRVRNNQVKEGELHPSFESQPSNVGTKVSGCVLFNEKLNTFYLQVEVFPNSVTKTEYFVDGNTPIEKDEFKNFLPSYSSPVNQELENPVVVRTFKLKSIKRISLNGEKFEVGE